MNYTKGKWVVDKPWPWPDTRLKGMREHKYKVWHKPDKCMYWFDLSWGTMYGAGSGWWAVVPWGETRKHHPDNRYLVDPGDCVPLKYTGLTGRNEVEMYEGDVVKATNGHLFLIVWRDGLACFDAQPIGCQDEMMSIGWPLAEVVGNVWEHPEIIGGEG